MQRQARRHQHRDLFALGRLAGHRLRHPGQHGARGGRLGARAAARGQAALARRQAAGGDAGDRRQPRPQAPERRAGRKRRRRRPGRAGRHQDRRSHRQRRRHAGRGSERLRLSLRHQAARRHGAGRRRCGRASASSFRWRCRALPETPRDEVEIRARSPFLGATVANLSPAFADELRLDPQARGRRHHRRRRRLRRRNRSASRRATSSSRSTARRSKSRRICERIAGCRRPQWRITIDARRPADFRHVSADELTRPRQKADRTCSPRRASTRRAAAARRQAAARTSSPTWSGRIICSAPTARSRACWGRARSARWFLGAAGHRQDHGGAASGARDRALFRADFGDLFRRRRSEESVRRGARAPRDRAGDAALRRRDSPLQSRPAGLLPAGDGRRHHRAGRRDHGKPVVRTDRAAVVARARPGVQAARRGGGRKAACPRRGDRRQDAAARRRGARLADPHGGRRRPCRAHACRRGLARRAPRRDFDAAALQEVVQSRAPIYDKTQDGHYNLISALHKSVRGSDPDAALYYLCAHARRRRGPALSGAPHRAHGGRGYRACRSAGAGRRQRGQGCLRFSRLARRRARHRRGGASTSPPRRNRTPPIWRSARRCAPPRKRLAVAAQAHPQRADQVDEDRRLRHGLRIRPRRAGGASPARTISRSSSAGGNSTIRPSAASSAKSGSGWSIGRSCAASGAGRERQSRTTAARRRQAERPGRGIGVDRSPSS